MIIAANTRFLLPDRMDGIGWFTYETLRRITTQHPEHTFHFFFDRPFDKQFIFSSNIVPHVIPPPARHPLLWHAWFQWAIPRMLKKTAPDLFFSPDGFVPLHTSVPVIPVIHDLNFEHYPGELPFQVQTYYRKMFRKFARSAKEIITVSQFSRNDIIHQYRISPDKVRVTYNGINPLFHPISDEDKMRVRRDLTAGAPYILQTSSILPRKNIVRLLQAFDLFRERQPHYKLVLAGGNLFGINNVKSTLRQMKYSDEVIFTGHIGAEKLVEITGAAEIAVQFSYFEGFGLPLLEAMACEVPVICSNATALPEIAGKAAIYVDPFSVENMADALTELHGDPERRQQMIALGNTQVSRFSWDITADGIWEILIHAGNG